MSKDADQAHTAFHEWFSRWVGLHGRAPAHFDAWLDGYAAGAAQEREVLRTELETAFDNGFTAGAAHGAAEGAAEQLEADRAWLRNAPTVVPATQQACQWAANRLGKGA